MPRGGGGGGGVEGGGGGGADLWSIPSPLSPPQNENIEHSHKSALFQTGGGLKKK